MADSEESKEKQGENLPAKPSEEIVLHHATGAPVKVLRGDGGKFVRQPKVMPSSREFTRVTRNYMLNMQAGKDGKITKGSQSKYQMMVENMICISRGVPTVLPNGDTIEREPKADMAAAQAYKVLTDRGLGQLPKSDEEMDAMKDLGGVRVVVIMPPEMVNKQITEEKPKPALTPSFIEAEFPDEKS
jgi:hypothetical protein